MGVHNIHFENPSCIDLRPLGGADTTVSAEYAFFLAMVLNPGKTIPIEYIHLDSNMVIF